MFPRTLKPFEGRELLHVVLGNALWQVGDKVVRLGIGLLVSIWIARYLGPGNFGLLNYAIAFVALFSSIADGGMQSVIVRELVQRREQHATIVCSALTLRLVAAITAIVLAITSARMLRPDDHNSVLIVTIVSLSLLPQAWDIIDYEHQSRFNSRPVVLTRAMSFILFSILKIILILLHAQVLWFGCAVVGESAFAAVVMRMLPEARSSLAQMTTNATWKEITHLIRISWPLMIASLSVMLYMRIDQVMLGQMLGDREVGTFSAAVRVSESWYFLPVAVISAVAPALVARTNESVRRNEQDLLMVMRILCWLAIGIALVLSVEANRLIAFLYGPNYAAAGSVLAIHAWAGVFVSLGVGASPWFINNEMLKFRMLQTFVGAAVNITLNCVLIPRYGVNGSAFATLVSYGVSGLLLNSFSRGTWPIFVLQMKAFLPR